MPKHCVAFFVRSVRLDGNSANRNSSRGLHRLHCRTAPSASPFFLMLPPLPPPPPPPPLPPPNTSLNASSLCP
ncbi:hypothetical protein E2C01_099521 [Portunus trituberculatus]|uniref:Uncharacterized protein n=1 Tax=Portunus trituberculatus TaxID=210409 RepID=A0A5B7KH21_PORTR|nr:hypothetical protein [Portunus trituberculatus]